MKCMSTRCVSAALRRGLGCLTLLSLLVGGESMALAAKQDEPAIVVKEESVTEAAKTVIEDAGALLTLPTRMEGRDWLMVGGAAAVVGGLIAVDKPIQDWVDRNNKNSQGRKIADGFSAVGGAPGMAGVNIGVIGLGIANQSLGGGSWIKEAGLIGLEAEAFAVAATAIIKEVSGRSRPEQRQGATNFNPFSGGGSFGSVHAAASFAVASVYADRFDPAIGWLGYGFAAAVAASRVYTDKHFTSDVVLGSLIGWGMGKFISRRHGADPTDWHIRPVALERGMGTGLMIGRAF